MADSRCCAPVVLPSVIYLPVRPPTSCARPSRDEYSSCARPSHESPEADHEINVAFESCWLYRFLRSGSDPPKCGGDVEVVQPMAMIFHLVQTMGGALETGPASRL